jgi:NAD-dependent deacetylase
VLQAVVDSDGTYELTLPFEALQQAADMLRHARHAVALTGAGLSTPSGIPDFRSHHTGLWDRVDPMEVASMSGFRRKPEAFFEWVRPLARTIAEAQPNPAHYALSELEAQGIIKALITQNIDMLHSRAGTQLIYEVHGHLRESTCVECFRVFPSEQFLSTFIETGAIPHCPVCEGILKPNVILFGEALPVKILHAAQREARECDVMLVAGSSLEVAPASELPLIAIAHGARVILINLEPTYLDDQAAVVMHGDVADVLPRLTRLVESSLP